jgi:tetratricopeptide (TPR) repeat protein/GT2 family glycosyltransferase
MMVSVIIPHYRKPEQLARCIEHLKHQTVELDLFIRDNNADNVYFTAAVNEGIRKCLGKDCTYLLVLNQDMYLEPGAVAAMVQCMETHPMAGIASPLEHLRSQPEGQVLAGGLDAFPFGVHQTGTRSEFSHDSQIAWANGSCMMLRKEMVHQIGLLDEGFRLICSDSDYSFTARSRGWQVWRVGAAYGLHEHGASGAGKDMALELMKIEDMLHFARKWLTGGLYRRLAHDTTSLTDQAVAQTVAHYEEIRNRLVQDLVTRAAQTHVLPACSTNPEPAQALAEMVASLRAAARHLQVGELDQAELLYRKVLSQQPGQALALHSLGLIAFQQGRLKEAEEWVTQAVRSDPASPHQYNTLGVILDTQGRPDEAIHSFEQAIHLKADYAEAHRNLAAALRAQGRADLSLDSLRTAAQLEPERSQTHFELAEALKQQGLLQEAVMHYTQALDLRPDLAEAHNNLATTFKELGHLEEAARCQLKAISLRPQNPGFHGNMAAILQDQERIEEAIAYCRKAQELAPEQSETYVNLGSVLRDAGRLDEAIAANAEALRRSPDSATAHWNQAICLLMMGRLSAGWKEYAWRRRVNYTVCYPFTHPWPLWNGEDYRGKTLFVHCEQGLGDALQFVRYLPAVKERGGTVVFGAWKPLCRLFAGLDGVDELVELSWQQPPAVQADLQVSLLDLPGIFGTRMEDLPGRMPYLATGGHRLQQGPPALEGPDFKVGLVWAGSRRHSRDPQRSCPLVLFEPLTQIPGLRLYSIQKDLPNPQDLQKLQRWGIVDLADLLQDFEDTAAVLERLDLVISVDTSVLHLAGAMGRPAWGLIARSPDWRWMLHREDSPWYPTLRLFRQPHLGDWQSVVDRVAVELQRQIRPRAPEVKPVPDPGVRVRPVRSRKVGAAGTQT